MYINIVETFSLQIFYLLSIIHLLILHFLMIFFVIRIHFLCWHLFSSFSLTRFCDIFFVRFSVVWYFSGLREARRLCDCKTIEETRKVELMATSRRVFSFKYSNFHRSFQYIRCRCYWRDIKTTFSELKEIEQWRTQTITEREQKLSSHPRA